MVLVASTVAVIALLIAALAIFLFRIGVLLNRTADDLDDCSHNVTKVAHQAQVIGPAIERINETGTTVVGALPLLCDDAERIGVAKGAPYADPSEAPHSAPSPAPIAATSEAPARASVNADSPQRIGYLDEAGPRGSLGLLDT